jgi:hypothetical protein
MVRQRLEEQEKMGPQPTPEAPLVDLSSLSEDQRAMYETYRSVLQRSPEEVRQALDEYQNALRERMENETNNPAPDSGTKP